MGIENGDNHLRVAVRGYVCREIHLSANRELRLALVKFRYIKRCFLVKDYLWTTDRKSQDPERLIAFQYPIVAHVREQLLSRLIYFHDFQ